VWGRFVVVRRPVALAGAIGVLLVALGAGVALATNPGQNGAIAFRR
jgi:hypothetical protein